MVSRKGAGYAIELMASIFILLAFAAGSFSIPDPYDWSDYQREVAGQDLTYTLKDTGHITHFLENAETGSLKTAATELSGRDMRVSGTIENLPMVSTSVGYYVLDKNRYPDQTLQSSLPECDGDLSELKSEIQPGTSLLRTDPSNSRESYHGVTLYVGDTDPRISGGFNSEEDYDTVWVDNRTQCQFASDEGPYYLDEFFLWGNTTDGDPENHYDIKSIDSNSLKLFKADQPVEMRNMLSREVNGVETNVPVDTFTLNGYDLSDYDVAVFREKESIDDIQFERSKVEKFMEEGSILFLINFDESTADEPFVEDLGLEWVDMDHSSVNPGNIEAEFDMPAAEKAKNYFEGLDGDTGAVSLELGGWIKTRGKNTVTSDEGFIVAKNQDYNSDNWDSSSSSMSSVSAPTGAPAGSGYTMDNFNFPDGSSYDVLSTCLGSCTNDIRGLNIDLNDNNDFGDEGEGPFLEGDRLIIANRTYEINIPDGAGCNNGECAEFLFVGSDDVDLVNHKTSFRGIDGERMARAAYEQDYEEEDLKLLASTIYWLRGDQVSFQQQYQPKFSTTAVGVIDDRILMPYKLNLRWSDE